MKHGKIENGQNVNRFNKFLTTNFQKFPTSVKKNDDIHEVTNGNIIP